MYRKRFNIKKVNKLIFPFSICFILLVVFFWQLISNAVTVAEETEEVVTLNQAGAAARDIEVLPTDAPVAAVIPEPDWNLVLLNKTHFMEAGYVPELAVVEEEFYFDSRAVAYLQQMLEDGRLAGMDLRICSAYRDLEKQNELYEEQVALNINNGLSYEEACEEAKTVVAYPGTSEHNIGLAVDIVAGHYQKLDELQEETDEAKWLKENCWKYGFILRYPIDKTDITGIIFEPWHYRYVGIGPAKEIMERGICLEEYMKEKYGIE